MHGTKRFFPENWRRFADYIPSAERGDLLEGAERLHQVPGYIVQGRYDMICPPRYADQLARAWPGARLEIVPDAGHSAFERGTVARLLAATEACKGLT